MGIDRVSTDAGDPILLSGTTRYRTIITDARQTGTTGCKGGPLSPRPRRPTTASTGSGQPRPWRRRRSIPQGRDHQAGVGSKARAGSGDHQNLYIDLYITPQNVKVEAKTTPKTPIQAQTDVKVCQPKSPVFRADLYAKLAYLYVKPLENDFLPET